MTTQRNIQSVELETIYMSSISCFDDLRDRHCVVFTPERENFTFLEEVEGHFEFQLKDNVSAERAKKLEYLIQETVDVFRFSWIKAGSPARADISTNAQLKKIIAENIIPFPKR